MQGKSGVSGSMLSETLSSLSSREELGRDSGLLLTFDPHRCRAIGGGTEGGEASVLAELTRAARRVAGQAGRAPIVNWPLRSNQPQPLEWKIDFL